MSILVNRTFLSYFIVFCYPLIQIVSSSWWLFISLLFYFHFMFLNYLNIFIIFFTFVTAEINGKLFLRKFVWWHFSIIFFYYYFGILFPLKIIIFPATNFSTTIIPSKVWLYSAVYISSSFLVSKLLFLCANCTYFIMSLILKMHFFCNKRKYLENRFILV